MRKVLVALGFAAMAAGCAGTPRMGDGERLALYQAHAGAEVRSFRLMGGLDGWSLLGDSALVVWTRPREAWLLELGGPCTDLDYATAVSLTSSTGQIFARFDSVVPLGPMTSQVARIPCRIARIRPLDTQGIKQAREELRQARSAPRADEAGQAP